MALSLLEKFSDQIKKYNFNLFRDDFIAGTTTAVVAVPLALAFGLASGVGAAAGLYSAVVAGFIASIFGGSRFQVTGPTGGMVAVLVFVVSQYGIEKALIAGLLAGIIQIIFGIAKLGKAIKFIPFSVVTGFTAGIAVVIALSQKTNAQNAPLIVLATIAISFGVRKISPKIPASLFAVITMTLAVYFLGINAPKLGAIPSTLPVPHLPNFNLLDLKDLIKPALVLAVLGSIESLLSAVVADGMTPDEKHDSNRELIGQGAGNIAAPLFGGIAATGAIARTAVNINAGAKTRMSGVIHSLVILLMMLTLAPLAAQIPLAVLAGVLIVAAIRMIEWEDIVLLYKSSHAGLIVMGLTLAVTILVDLVTAVEVGLIASGALFIYRMSDLGIYQDDLLIDEANSCEITPRSDPRIIAFRLDGPLFFGAAEKFIKVTTAHPQMQFLILRMRRVNMIDTTGIVALQNIHKQLKRQNCQLLISGLREDLYKQLSNAGFLIELEEKNVFKWTREATAAAQQRLLTEKIVINNKLHTPTFEN